MKNLIRVAAFSLLVGCTAAPVYTGAPVEVGAGELGRFWLPAPEESDVRVPAEAQEKRIPGRVVVRYVIDSEGRVIEPRVESAEPPGVYNRAALDLIRTQRFRPAPGNDQRLPVRTRTEVTFNLPQDQPTY